MNEILEVADQTELAQVRKGALRQGEYPDSNPISECDPSFGLWAILTEGFLSHS